MDLRSLKDKITRIYGKYKYVALIVAAGIVLMSIPKVTDSDASASAQPIDAEQEQVTLTQELEEILSSIEGCGRVKVLLTYSAGEEHIYQQDTDVTSSDKTAGESSSTVIVSDGGRSESPVMRQIIPPVCRGAVIVCQGGDSPVVQLAIVQAVSSATGLTADKITVLKMK